MIMYVQRTMMMMTMMTMISDNDNSKVDHWNDDNMNAANDDDELELSVQW